MQSASGFGERIWGDIATILLGAIVGLFVAGATGKLWSAIRWPSFSIVFLLWTAVVITSIAAGRRSH